jgi:hypothetical protein
MPDETQHLFLFFSELTSQPLRIKALPMKKTLPTPIFRDQISQFSADTIARVVGCSKPTAYDWLNGRRRPPLWCQPDIVTKLQADERAGKVSA